jgi:hypothetical protein
MDVFRRLGALSRAVGFPEPTQVMLLPPLCIPAYPFRVACSVLPPRTTSLPTYLYTPRSASHCFTGMVLVMVAEMHVQVHPNLKLPTNHPILSLI